MAGPCRGYFPSYSWDGKTCRLFIYGGCGGTRNNFPSKGECLEECRGKPRPGGVCVCDKPVKLGQVGRGGALANSLQEVTNLLAKE